MFFAFEIPMFYLYGHSMYISHIAISSYGTHGGACVVMVIVVGNEHGDTSSNPERDWLHFT